MRWVRLQEVLSGVILAEDLKDEVKGTVIFKKGKKMSKADIALLKSKWNITRIPVETIEKVPEKKVKTTDLGNAIDLKRSIYVEEIPALRNYGVLTTMSIETIKKILDAAEEVVKEIYEKGSFDPRYVRMLADDVVDEAIEKENLQPLLLKFKSLDDYTYTHSINVAMLSLYLGINMNLSRDKLVSLICGALLLDIGKCKIPKDILLLPRKLTPKEFEIIKKHPVFGYNISKKSSINDDIAGEIILDHHERLDGTGYPGGKKKSEIGYFASIVSIADEYDAITSKHPYKAERSPYVAMSEIIVNAGHGKLNPDIVSIFVNKMGIYPKGTVIHLPDGTKVISVRQNPGTPIRPIVRVLESEHFEKGTILDLSKIDLIIKSVSRIQEE